MIIAAMVGRFSAVSLCRLLIGSSVMPLAILASADARANDAGKTVTVPARLEVRFAPNVDPAGTAGMAVELQIPAPRLEAGKPLLRMPLILVSVPTAAYPASAIEAADTAGRLELTVQDEAPGPSGTYRNYVANRATQGPVTVRYRAVPREVSAATRNGPLFDLRREGDGLMGSGVYFMALPPDPAPINIRLSWDLPSGFRGVSSRGEGEQTWQGPADSLAYSFYATGPVRSLPEDGKGDFVLYWLKAPPMDPVALGTGAQRLYKAMAAFFDDKGSGYRIFARSNPYASGGGTALSRSFMFGYGSNGITSSTGTDMLIAHEMAHTWPKMAGDHPQTAWYTEGTAEYYSTLLSLRAGTIDHARFLSLINLKAEAYYTSPFQSLSNAEVGKKFWTDGRAQRVPYERGFLYLAGLDAQLKAASNGARSVDDLVLDVLKAQRGSAEVGVPEWRAMVVKALGAPAGQAFDDMVAGKLIVPPSATYGPCFQMVPASLRPFDMGFDGMRPGVVGGLRAGSAAELAGLREGDVVVKATPASQLRENPAMLAEMAVMRDGQPLTIRFLPRGKPVNGWQWQRVPGIPASDCKL
jgi:hypothetical protein